MKNREYYMNPDRKTGRIPKDGIRRVYTIAEMSQRHHEIARRLVLGESNKSIAASLGLSPLMVSNVRNSPIVKEQMSYLSAKKDQAVVQISERIAEALPKCVEYLTKTIENDEISDTLRSKNAFGLLAAGGHGPSKNLNVRGVHQVLTPDDIREIRKEAEQIGMASGIIDITEDSK